MNCPLAAARRRSIAGAVVVLDQFGLLDHHHRIGAARDDAAGGDRGRGAGRHFDRGLDAAGDHFGIERQAASARRRWRRRYRRRARQSRRHWSGRTAAHRPARSRRPRARGRAPRRAARLRRRSGERSVQASKRRRASAAETTSRNCSCRAARRTASRIAAPRGSALFGFLWPWLTATCVPAGKPSLSAGTTIQPSLRASAANDK